MSYDDDWFNSLLERATAGGANAADLQLMRDINTLSVGDLAKRSRDMPHRRRQTVEINGVERRETLKERLRRERDEAEAAIMALAGKLVDRDKQLKHLERFPDEDPFIDGEVLFFEKSFPNTPDQKYSYTAVRIAGHFHVSGARSPQNVTWAELVDWMGLGVDEVYRLGESGREKIIG